MTHNSEHRGQRSKPTTDQINRRQVLGGLSVAGVMGALAPAGQPDAAELPSDAVTPEYQETDHIRRFYELARR